MSMYYMPARSDELYHYGVMGMKWGVRRYQNYDGTLKHPKKKTLSPKVKKAIITTAKVGIAALGVYALYKTGTLDNVVKTAGNAAAQNITQLHGRERVKADILNAQKRMKAMEGQGPFAAGNAERKASGNGSGTFSEVVKNAPSDIKRLSKPEKITESLKNANPKRHKNGCVNAAIAGYLRNLGFDVTAQSTGGNQQIAAGIAEEVFKGAKVFDGNASTFAKSTDAAGEMIRKRFGDNNEGFVSIQWKNKKAGGHTFNYKTVNGVTKFFDYSNGNGSVETSKYWKSIDPNDALSICNIDGCPINWEAVKKYAK